MAMILNLSIGEEVELDAKQLEGKTVGNTDEVSIVESSKGAAIIEDDKTQFKNAETVV
jgi:hypothetical protein